MSDKIMVSFYLDRNTKEKLDKVSISTKTPKSALFRAGVNMAIEKAEGSDPTEYVNVNVRVRRSDLEVIE